MIKKNKLNAFEMFEKLDYKQTKTENCVYYTDGFTTIEFIFYEKTYVAYLYDIMSDRYMAISLDMDIFRAIYMQLYELGWLND